MTPRDDLAARVAAAQDADSSDNDERAYRMPEGLALVADLWNAYLTACDKADGRDRSEANVRRLTRELDEARGRIDSAFCMLAEGPDAIGGLEAREQAIKILRGDK